LENQSQRLGSQQMPAQGERTRKISLKIFSASAPPRFCAESTDLIWPNVLLSLQAAEARRSGSAEFLMRLPYGRIRRRINRRQRTLEYLRCPAKTAS
jgi:hypothetical protein